LQGFFLRGGLGKDTMVANWLLNLQETCGEVHPRGDLAATLGGVQIMLVASAVRGLPGSDPQTRRPALVLWAKEDVANGIRPSMTPTGTCCAARTWPPASGSRGAPATRSSSTTT